MRLHAPHVDFRRCDCSERHPGNHMLRCSREHSSRSKENNVDEHTAPLACTSRTPNHSTFNIQPLPEDQSTKTSRRRASRGRRRANLRPSSPKHRQARQIVVVASAGSHHPINVRSTPASVFNIARHLAKARELRDPYVRARSTRFCTRNE